MAVLRMLDFTHVHLHFVCVQSRREAALRKGVALDRRAATSVESGHSISDSIGGAGGVGDRDRGRGSSVFQYAQIESVLRAVLLADPTARYRHGPSDADAVRFA